MKKVTSKDPALIGVCETCGTSTKQGNHEKCGVKHLDDPEKKVRVKNRYKQAAKQYKNGRLPWWMYD